jgi:hypothetical protein
LTGHHGIDEPITLNPPNQAESHCSANHIAYTVHGQGKEFSNNSYIVVYTGIYLWFIG